MTSSPFAPENQDQAWIDLYRPFLVAGSVWRRDCTPQKICHVTEVGVRYVEALWAATSENDERHKKPFLCSIGIFLRAFSPASQIKSVRPVALETTRAILKARQEATQLHKQAIKQRLKGLASALEGEKSELVQRIEEILDTEIDQQEQRAVAYWKPESPRLVGGEDPVSLTQRPGGPDRSDQADAARFRWLLDGHGYYMEESGLCGHGPCDQEEQDEARASIDRRMADG